MKRVTLLVAAMLVLQAAPVQARERNAKPRIRIASITAQPGGSEVVEHVITIEAVDRDGVVGEVALDFGDGVMVWLLLACDSDPGDPVTLEVNWSYAPGKYALKAWGYSTPNCSSGSFQESRTDKRHLKVR